MTLDEYYQLLAAGQQYVQNAQAADPAWQDWLTSQSNYNLDTAGSVASPTTDYWGQYMATLSPQQQAEFAQTMAQLKDDRWTTKVGSVMPYVIGAGLTYGALAPLLTAGGAAGATGAAADAAAGAGFVGEGALSGIPAWDGALANAAGASAAGAGAGFIGEGASSGIPAWDSALTKAGGGTLLDSIVNKAPSLLKDGLRWAADNKGLLSLLAGGLAAAGASGQQNTQAKKTFAPQAGMSFSRPQSLAPQSLQGTFTPGQSTGLLNSGLSRYGATGGTYTPFNYKPWG
jgi:hypothetical protein